MNKFFGLLAVLVSVLVFNSCNDKVDLTGDFRPTVVVHGLLDQSDSVHYIKINRAFIGPGNAFDIAQIPDSSLFENIVATITETVNGSQTRVWQLKDTLVDGKSENGVFYAGQETLYYFHTINQSPLNPNAKYLLDINIDNGKIRVTGETDLVRNMTTNVTPTAPQFKFYNNLGEYTSQGITVSSTGNAYVVNAAMLINYREDIGGNQELKSFKWNLGESNVTPNTSKTFSASGRTFYELIQSNATNNPAITRRVMRSLTIIFTGGHENLYNYISVNKPSSSLAQSKPSFTNLVIEGDARVIGIFSSRLTLKIEKQIYITNQQAIRAIDKNSMRQLCIGPITGSLLFCSQHIADQDESWYCQ
jgi:hypothetical protein